MSAISLKSISGITSITTPAGVDNQFTLHNNNTTEAVKLDTAGNFHFHNHLNITGISTAANFKTGTSNLHSTGLNIFDLDVDGHTNLDNVSVAGVTTNASTTYFDNQVYWRNSGTDKMFTLSNNGGMNWQDNVKAEFGNSGDLKIYNVSSENHIHGSTSQPIIFSTNNDERLRIDSGGGVQVGTSTATASKLTVYGANDAAAIFQGSGTGTGAGNGLLVGNNGGTTGLLWNYENGNTKIATNNVERLRITSTGRLNTGDTDLTQNVDQFCVSVTADNALDNVARFQSTAAASGTSESLVKIYKGAGYGGVISGYITQGSDHGLKFYTANNASLTERLRINSSGVVETYGGGGAAAVRIKNGGDAEFYAANNSSKVTLHCDTNLQLTIGDKLRLLTSEKVLLPFGNPPRMKDFTVTGILSTAFTTASVISSIKHKSFSAADPAPLFVTFGTGQP